MFSIFFRLLQNDRPLVITSIVVVLLALLPTRWLIPWTADVGSIIALPLTPLGHAAGSAVAFFRPPSGEALPSISELDRIVDERDAYRGRWHAARLEIEQLETELAQLQRARKVPGSVVSSDWTPRTATIVRHTLGGQGGVMRINAGARQGVLPGTVVVVDGDQLVGRIAGGVGPLASTLVPIGDVSGDSRNDLLARIQPQEETIGATYGIPIRLRPIGGGFLEGLVASEPGSGSPVQPGQPVRLARDPAWDDTAWGMLIGTVRSVENSEETPLRRRVVVQCTVMPERLLNVTLKIKDAGMEAIRRTASEQGGAP